MPTVRTGYEYPPKSGIIISPKLTPKGKSAWRIDISAKRTGSRREQRQFPTKEKAQAYAENRQREIANVGKQAFALDARQRSDAVQALAILGDCGLTLTKAAEIALKHMPAKGARLTVIQLRERFLAEPGRKKNKLVARRASSLADLRVRTMVFCNTHGGTFADEISTEAAKSWLGGMALLTPTTRNNYRRALHALFAYGVREGHCAENPISRVPMFSVPESSPTILSVSDASRLIHAAYETQNELGLLPYITLAMFAGLRRAEIASI